MHGKNDLKAVTIGDINIDHVIDIADLSHPLSLELSGCFFRPIRTFVGGNGVFFAEEAKAAGFAESYLLATIGADRDNQEPDRSAHIAINHLKQSGVRPILSYDIEKETGQVLILYQPDDRRFMIADRGANTSFTLNNLPSRAEKLVAEVDLLYVSGYCLLNEDQRSAVQYLMQLAKQAGTFSIVDIVPHNVYLSTEFDTFKKWTGATRAVSAEASTILGFLNIIDAEREILDYIPHILGALRQAYEFFLIRLDNQSNFLIANKHEDIIVRIPYSGRVSSLRFTDRVLAKVILTYRSNNNSLSWSESIIQELVHLSEILL